MNAGAGVLLGLAVRRDRVVLLAWILVLAGVVVGIAASLGGLYATPAARQDFATGVAANPATIALYGPLFGTSLGALVAWRTGLVGLLAGVMSLLTVIRHTRAEEEVGLRELLGAAAVGRRAGLSAALLVTLAANLALAVLVAGGLVATGLPAPGAIALGLSIAGAGAMFAAVAAVAAQLTESARAARGIATAALGLAFLVRAVGNAAGLAWLSWLTPLGWTQQARPFAGQRWWVFALVAGFVALVSMAAYRHNDTRDLGAGLLSPRAGRERAGDGLRGPLGLAWRLQRASLIGWAAGLALLGAVVGSIAAGVGDLLKGSPQLVAAMGGRDGLVDGFLTTSLGVLGIITAAFAVQATLRLRAEEVALRAEPVLAAAIGRSRWASSHLTVAIAGSALLLLAGGLGAGLAHGLCTGDVGRELPRVLAAALAELPAAWVLVGVTMILIGLVPRLSVLGWGAVALFLLLGQLGRLLGLDQWMLDVSPFSHVPDVLGGQPALPPLVWLSGLTAVLIAAGLAGVRRRDIG